MRGLFSTKVILGLLIFALPGVGSALTFDSRVPAEIQKQMLEDLRFISEMTGEGQTPMHKDIFGSVNGSVYDKFFNSRITSVGLSGCGNPNAVACVIPMMNSNKMWLTNNFIRFNHPQVARMMVVYHESRHSEVDNGNWPHDNCPDPYLDEKGQDIVSIWTGAKVAGNPACDSTHKGSYGSSTIMLKNIAKYCTNCSDKVKMDADMYAEDQLNRIHTVAVKQAMRDDFNSK